MSPRFECAALTAKSKSPKFQNHRRCRQFARVPERIEVELYLTECAPKPCAFAGGSLKGGLHDLALSVMGNAGGSFAFCEMHRQFAICVHSPNSRSAHRANK